MATARTEEVPARYLSAGLEKMGAEIGQPSEGGDGLIHTGKASGSACTQAAAYTNEQLVRSCANCIACTVPIWAPTCP